MAEEATVADVVLVDSTEVEGPAEVPLVVRLLVADVGRRRAVETAEEEGTEVEVATVVAIAGDSEEVIAGDFGEVGAEGEEESQEGEWMEFLRPASALQRSSVTQTHITPQYFQSRPASQYRCTAR